MSERKVNLEEILSSELSPNYPQFDFLPNDACSRERALLAMREACRQVLELAAENADWDCDRHHENIYVDKQSITNTINQVE